jgi:UDP-N-acetylmuramate--alanine ligase
MIGIGGSGMAGIAEILLTEGFKVSGSDPSTGPSIARLKTLGAEIYTEHQAQQVAGANVVVVSSAIPKDNPEVVYAHEHRIPVISRAQMLAETMRFRKGIAVAGTHGKTTTTSLIASILAEAQLDPTYIIGGKLNAIGSNARLGKGEYMVAEADESDASFLFLQPTMAVVTNVDFDHMSTYGDDPEQLYATFLQFLHHMPFYGVAVVCLDDAGVRHILPKISRPVVTYGFDRAADVRGEVLEASQGRTHFRVTADSQVFECTLNLPGLHNVENALAAIAIALELEVAPQAIHAALSKFEGVGRRFQTHGLRRLAQHTFELVDDYGHHPREIEATLQALAQNWPTARKMVIFQPHRYSRTRDLFDEFVRVLSQVDGLVLLDVYPAGEAFIAGADSKALAHALRMRGFHHVTLAKDVQEVMALLPTLLHSGDALLTLGAGSVGQLPAEILRVSDDVQGVA